MKKLILTVALAFAQPSLAWADVKFTKLAENQFIVPSITGS